MLIECAASLAEDVNVDLAILPNLNQGMLTIGDGNSELHVSVLSELGAMVQLATRGLTTLDLTDLAPGHYMVMIARNGHRSMHRVVRA